MKVADKLCRWCKNRETNVSKARRLLMIVVVAISPPCPSK